MKTALLEAPKEEPKIKQTIKCLHYFKPNLLL